MREKRLRRLNSDNTDKFLEHGIDVDNRIIHIVDDIDSKYIAVIMAGIQLMLVKSAEKDINIYVNSPGGDPYTAFGLYDFIKTLDTVTVNMYNVGLVASAASIIFMAGDNRYMYENTVFMLHSVSSSASGKVHLDLDDEVEECKKIHKQLCQIYASHTIKSEKVWDSHLKHKDRHYRAKEALEIGIVHKVIKKNGS
jgi:ATP-dependent Clp protease protease subunit